MVDEADGSWQRETTSAEWDWIVREAGLKWDEVGRWEAICWKQTFVFARSSSPDHQ